MAWDGGVVKYGLKSYVTPSNLKKQLKASLNNMTDEHVEIAQMLCFREICLANLVDTKQDSKALLFNFIATYPSLVLKIIREHPEYCIDGKLIPIIIGVIENGNGIDDNEGVDILAALTDISTIDISMTDIVISGAAQVESTAPAGHENSVCVLQ